MRTLVAIVSFLGALAFVTPVHAWEADTTHAGLTEGAALASKVNARLRLLHGRRGGWLEPLSLLADRAPALYKKLAAIEPTSGVVPDRRGRQSALAWLIAGSVIEGIPGERDRNHFYDPSRKTGLTGEGAGGLVSPKSWGMLVGEGVPMRGMAAPDWTLAKENDLGLGRFWLELERSVTAPSRGARDEHLAMALLTAGALLHVLEDLGAPAHARDDLREHLLPLGAGPADRGSRFERLAALLYGRLGVPAPSAPAGRDHYRDFFTGADGKGLADLTHVRWYSYGTLPGETVVRIGAARGDIAKAVAKNQRFPLPRPERDLRTRPSTDPDGHALRDTAGVCLANYHVEDGHLKFAISDACAAEQMAVILPEIGGYATGLLDWLFRGALAVAVVGGSAQISVPEGEAALGAGKLTVLGEDAEGRRTVLSSAPWQGPTAVPVPDGVQRVFAVFRGVDGAGEELVAVGSGSP